MRNQDSLNKKTLSICPSSKFSGISISDFVPVTAIILTWINGWIRSGRREERLGLLGATVVTAARRAIMQISCRNVLIARMKSPSAKDCVPR